MFPSPNRHLSLERFFSSGAMNTAEVSLDVLVSKVAVEELRGRNPNRARMGQ